MTPTNISRTRKRVNLTGFPILDKLVSVETISVISVKLREYEMNTIQFLSEINRPKVA